MPGVPVRALLSRRRKVGGGVSAGGGTGAALGVLGSALQKCVAFWVPSLAFNNRALLPAA